MNTYIALLRFTQKGIENIKKAPGRLEAAKEAYRSVGAEIKAFYLTLGDFDAVVILEAPNDEIITKGNLIQATLGNVRTQTHRAFTEDEYRKIVADLP